jgi:hypothetical protein
MKVSTPAFAVDSETARVRHDIDRVDRIVLGVTVLESDQRGIADRRNANLQGTGVGCGGISANPKRHQQ